MIRRLCTLALLLGLAPALAGADLGARLRDTRYLQGLRREARRIRQSLQPLPGPAPWEDVRCVLHAHSALSHDSRGTEAELVAAAREARVRAVFMTEHPTDDRRWLTQGLRGTREGVLFIPGAELSSGLLVWRDDRVEWTPDMTAADALRRLAGTRAVSFIAHPEIRKTDAEWELPPFHGMEIYNTHADASDSGYEALLADIRRSPLELFSVLGAVRRFPMETYASIFDEQAGVLKRWDALNLRFLETGRRVVGIAANDAHQNVGLRLKPDGDRILLEDALAKPVGSIPRRGALSLLLPTEEQTYQFDPYPVAFRYVSTHLLAREVSEEALFEALAAGRAYVAFDWIADPTGFDFHARARGERIELGGAVRVRRQPFLTARTPMPCRIVLLRNGEAVSESETGELTAPVTEPGVYRVEAWVELNGERRPWIYSNPIYVTAG